MRALRQTAGLSVAAIVRLHTGLRHIPRSTIYHHSKLPLFDTVLDKRIGNQRAGRPRLLDSRHMRSVLLEIQRFRAADIEFTAEELQRALQGVLPEMNIVTFRRYLHKWKYHFLVNRKKGILTSNDKKIRKRYARELKNRFRSEREQLSYWKKIMFVDIAGFQYKGNPYELATRRKGKSWRRRDESLIITQKGAKEGVKTAK